ncbi:MAG: conjugal transfer protein [Gammaproteobacteria bacterium HGW-Gammaproteobacteria-1]|jgi:conjugal transfer pilus assembly protein TraU|nr:MAG: conjugal transfer protein [Gammaproteobacteria bacterium HGW-Gammaproteobacteria-1]
MSVVRNLVVAIALTLVIAGPVRSEPCVGRFINPITDICWECVLPIMIDSPGICICPAPWPQFVRYGIVFSFWEPVWLVDITREPYCFTNLGMEIDPGFSATAGYPTNSAGSRDKKAFYQAHIYENFFWTASFGSMIDNACKLSYSGGGNYGVEWFTEFDPLWADDELAFILAVESALFANTVAQAACAADCVAATVGNPLDPLFWCAGCQGSLYPMGGNTSEQTGGIMASNLLAERLVAKMHRQMLAWDTTGWECGNSPMPIIKKSQYRTQVTYPIPRTANGCPSYGATEVPTAMGQEVPYSGEDFGYLIWRKRRCCVSN